jgi:hypothetical protein
MQSPIRAKANTVKGTSRQIQTTSKAKQGKARQIKAHLSSQNLMKARHGE